MRSLYVMSAALLLMLASCGNGGEKAGKEVGDTSKKEYKKGEKKVKKDVNDAKNAFSD